MRLSPLPWLVAFALLCGAPAVSAAESAADEVLKEVVMSLHASAVEKPSLAAMARSGLNALRDQSPCFEVMQKPGSLRMRCDSRQLEVPWPPKTGKETAILLTDAVKLADRRGNVEDKRVQWVARALAASLQDPYTAYLPPAMVARLDTRMRSQKATPGIELSPRDPTRIREVRPGSDAMRQGLQEGDRIVAVDRRKAKEMTYAELSASLFGNAGSVIRFDVQGRINEPPRRVSVARHMVPEALVDTEPLPGGVLFVRVSEFQSGATQEVAEEIWASRPRGVVLDLRHNHGGLIQEGVALLDLFFSDGDIGGVKPRKGRPADDFQARHQPTDVGVPLVVLVDGGSASASELVSLVLQERGRAAIIGSPSLGKGSVQKMIRMPDSGVLRVTSAHYIGPSGQPLGMGGVQPDRFLSPPVGRTVLDGGSAKHDSWVLSALDLLEGGGVPAIDENIARNTFYGPNP
jgi:carboxyl-terminal processing protease